MYIYYHILTILNIGGSIFLKDIDKIFGVIRQIMLQDKEVVNINCQYIFIHNKFCILDF